MNKQSRHSSQEFSNKWLLSINQLFYERKFDTKSRKIETYLDSLSAFRGYKSFTFSSGSSALLAIFRCMGLSNWVLPRFSCKSLIDSFEYHGEAVKYIDNSNGKYCNPSMDEWRSARSISANLFISYNFGWYEDPDIENCVEDITHCLSFNRVYKSRFILCSMGPNKLVNSIKGGVLLCKNPEDQDRVLKFRGAFNLGLSDIQDMVGYLNMLRLDQILEFRKELKRYYDTELESGDSVKLVKSTNVPVPYRYLVRVNDIDGFKSFMLSKGIICERPYSNLSIENTFTNALNDYNTVVSIPFHTALDSRQMQHIVKSIKSYRR